MADETQTPQEERGDPSHPLQQRHREEASTIGRRKRAAQRARRLAERKSDSMPVVEGLDGPRQVRVVDAKLVSPAPKGGLREVFKNKYLLRLIVRRELAQMYSASVLGLIWSYIQPAIRFATYYFVMGVILHMHRDVPAFALHLFSGMIAVHFFSETFQGGTKSIWQNRALVKRMSMPRELFPVASIVVALFHTAPQVVLLAVLCWLSGWHIDTTGVLAVTLGAALLAVFSMAIALLFSAFNVFYRDFQNIVGTINQFLHFMVPMMYPITRVLKEEPTHPLMVHLYLANPLSEAVMLIQRFFWYGVANQGSGRHSEALHFPNHLLRTGGIMLLASLALLVFAQWVFSRLENKFPERI